jgi:hypothetical protein
MQIGARTTNSLVQVSVLTGGTGYAVPPVVTISGGFGASAVAHLSAGRVESVVITSGGTGFTSQPTVSIAAASVSATISSFTAGTGNGTVTLASPVATTFSRIQASSTSATISHFASATQVVVNATSFPGSGAASLHASGTGAAATAYAYVGPLRPMSFFKGRFNDVYGIDGGGRGFRWNGTDAAVEKLGLVKPAVGPSMTASTTSSGGYVAAVQMVLGGAGYSSAPEVVLTGGSATTAAKARAYIAGGRVTRVEITERGSGYESTPAVSFTGGIGSGAAFTVGVVGRVADISVLNMGSGYASTASCTASSSSHVFNCPNHGLLAGSQFSVATVAASTSGVTTGTKYYAVSVGGGTFTAAATVGGTTNILSGDFIGVVNIPPPRLEFATTGGLTEASASVTIDGDGQISGAALLSGGTGLTTSSVAVTVVGGGGTGAILKAIPSYSVASVSVASSGSGYYTAPVLTFRAAPSDTSGSGAAATVYVNSTGSVTGVSMVSGGQYSSPPTAIILDTTAKAQATVARGLRGKYQCAVRYLDDTPSSERGPIPSSISELVEIDVSVSASSLTWTLSHYGLDDRVSAMELWRSTSDQSVALYRVATIQRTDPAFSGTYVDSLSDPDLQEAGREGFGVMPIVLPSGQINARRFGVLPGEFAVAAMFQDRAWFAVDTSGARPNALLYSEVDEPESVPSENELVLQENTTQPDQIVGLLPLGPQLLVAQSSHLYALSYVSQPVIDASLVLVAYRGMLNSQCGDVLGGVAVLADSFGLYAFDGNNAEALSLPIDNYWRDNVIDFSQSSKFHVRGDSATMTVRFFYCRSGDTAPVRALCYCMNTKAWWEETYPVAVTASCPAFVASKMAVLSATASGGFLKSGGLTDSGAAIPYSVRTGNMALANEGDRSISVLYKPTTSSAPVEVALHYNNSSTPRPNAIQTNTGAGFVAGPNGVTLDMSRTRSALGDASGLAMAQYSGRVDERSAGADRHIAAALSGEQTSDPVVLYALKVNGAE